MNLSRRLQIAQQEAKALKQSFESSGTDLSFVTKTINFTTEANNCRRSDWGDFRGAERVVVTLATGSAMNTIAIIEILCDSEPPYSVRRDPDFVNGARWIIANAPKEVSGNWAATNYTFKVHTLINGTLNARMIWE